MSSFYINGKEIPEYTLFPDDDKFRGIGYTGFPRGFREAVRKKLEELKESGTITKIGKYYLNGEETYIYQDSIIRDYFNNIGYSNTEVEGVDNYTWNDAFDYAKEIQENWDSSITSLGYKFGDDTKLVFMPMVDTSNVTSMSQCFKNCSSLTTIPLLNTSNVTGMYECFYGCTSLVTIPLLDTGNVTNMWACFDTCTSLTSIPELDTSNVTDMGSCFYYCKSLTSIPLLDTSNVTNMGGCFWYCFNLTTIPLLDTSNVTTLASCFYGCTSLLSIPELDTSNVTDMRSCFYDCSNLTEIPELNTEKVTNISRCFARCSNLKRIKGLSFKSMGSISSYSNFLFGVSTNTSCRYILIKDIGTNSECTTIDTTYARVWGINSEDVPDARQSLIDSLLTYSFDRREAGYSDCTITLYPDVKALLTEDEIHSILLKGYIIEETI